MQKRIWLFGCLAGLLLATGGVVSCKKDPPAPGNDTTIAPLPAFDINSIKDTYGELANYNSRFSWGPYNTHDPSIIKAGEWYYSYSTDAAYGVSVPPGIMVRKSKDLVQWFYVGSALNGLPAKGAEYIRNQGATPLNGLWAPYIMKVGNEYRLYYSLASSGFRVSAIGLFTSTSPEGPWVERGLAVTSLTSGPGTNAIDPSVVVTPSGEHWMVYGSAWDGLFELRLDPQTGLALNPGDKGVRVVRRGMTNGMYNGNLEGPEIIYNPANSMYYLFVAYDWLATKYNVRVFRSSNPNGPFLDYNGVNVDNQQDNGPMILAPYQFEGHGGWAGVAHCSVFDNGAGEFYMAHQGRPGVDRAFMVLHVRKIFWTQDGWPVVSPQRYAAVTQTAVAKTELEGAWEQIVLRYRVVPGYENEQLSPDYQVSTPLTLGADGSMNGNSANKWSYAAPWLELSWNNGQFTDRVLVERGRDWENKKTTILFTGLNNTGTAIWGKKKN
jgi:arabinan endo-1,5-alpha-L-arabinosidase